MDPKLKYACGTRVVVIHKEYPDMGPQIGATGTIVAPGLYLNRVGVEFDEEIEDGHGLSGKCKFGYGWYTLIKYISISNNYIDDPL